MSVPRIGINGLGRIGRAALKQALGSDRVTVAGANDLDDAEAIAYLLRHDSVYGADTRFLAGSVGKIQTTEGELPLFFEAGARYVILSADSSDADVVVVPGVNDDALDLERHSFISMASCTTNATAPVLRVLDDAFGIEDAYFTTVHAYTASQALVDRAARHRRRGRAAALNIIPTTTGAAKAVIKVLPHLEGRVTGMAMRVPVPSGSVVDIVARVRREVNADDVNEALRAATQWPALHGDPAFPADRLGGTGADRDEVQRMGQARRLRSVGRRGMGLRVHGQLLGQLLLRTFARAQRIYVAMKCRGFDGRVRVARTLHFSARDLLFVTAWSAAFVVFRVVNIPRLLGELLGGIL